MSAAGTLFDRLDEEWPAVVRAAAAAGVPARWAAEDEVLAPFAAGLDVLVAATEDRAWPPEEKDRVLSALARRAEGDEVAVRTLVQVLLPGGRALARRLGWMGSPTECASLVVPELWARVRTYPVERRPARVAANVLADVTKVLVGCDGRATRVEVVPLDEVDEADLVAELADGHVAAGELLGVLADAVVDGWFPAHAARLIAVTRVLGVSCAEVATAEGVAVQSVRRRRLRAEAALAVGVRRAA